MPLESDETGTSGTEPSGSAEGAALPELTEDRGVYASSSDLGVWTVNLTAPDTQALADVNNDVAGAAVQVIFRESGFGAADTAPNAVMQVRGRSTRLTIQKSFQITLASHADPWRGYRKINLNKHPYDLTRVRNRLSFDSFASIRHLTSLRTHFVHLYVNGDDYGLFTQIENPDGQFLAAHGLDASGIIYKASSFSWRPIDAAIDRLNRTIKDVIDPDQDINDVVRRHFQRDNLLAWMAVNLLTGNYDTGSQNFILYGPSGYQGWYLLPWDYDGALEFYQQPGQPALERWRAGLAAWWWVPLHQRFLSDPNNFRDLDARITELAQGAMADAVMDPRAASYHDVVKPFVSSPPDLWNLPVVNPTSPDDALAQWETEYARLAGVIGRRYAEYRATLGRPMPVWLYEPVPPAAAGGGPYTFSWSPSCVLGGGAFSYDLEVSRTADFAPESLVVAQRGLRQALATVTLPPGRYTWHVIVRADGQPQPQSRSDDSWQIPFSPDQMLVVP